MSEDNRTIERSYKFHLWGMALQLALWVSLTVGMTLALVSPELKMTLVTLPMAVFVLASVALGFAISGRRWPRATPADRSMLADEWVRSNINQARKIALRTAWLAQGPLMFFVAYVPTNPTVGTSVGGMAMFTMSLTGTAFCGTYLLCSRDRGDE